MKRIFQVSQVELPTVSKEKLQSRFLQAEDLALRVIQAEFGVNISGQVTAGADKGFDGAYIVGGRYYVVEIQYAMHRIDKHDIFVARCQGLF